jgi:hypothetical protein
MTKFKVGLKQYGLDACAAVPTEYDAGPEPLRAECARLTPESDTPDRAEATRLLWA